MSRSSSTAGAPRPDPRRDGLAAFWVVLWLVVGAWTGYEVWQLTALSRAAVDSGRSLRSAASALEQLDGVPLVGDTTAPLADQVGATAEQIVAGGERSERSVKGLAVLLGLAVGIGPSGPVVLLYLPQRGSRRAAGAERTPSGSRA